MTIELASDEVKSFQENASYAAPKRMPSPYVVCRGASQVPEILIADSDEAALATVSKQVKAGSGTIPVVFVYKLVSVVEFVAESLISDPETYSQSHFNKGN